MIDMFNCQEYDGDLRLVVDLQVQCWVDPMHQMIAYYVAGPCLIFWGLGIPLGVFMLMRKEKERLNTVNVRKQFGFLYNGYKPHNYFWEIVIMYRKIACIFIAVFLNRIGIIVQALVLIILLIGFLQVNNTNRPFKTRSLNDIENMSLATQIITIYCGIFFISGKSAESESFNKNKDFNLSSDAKFFFFIVISFFNFMFLVLWFVKLLDILRDEIKDSHPRFYTVIFLCGREDKMTQENVKRAQTKKKEAIIANIELIVLYLTNMQGMYVRDVFYEDHARFLKLLYHIEHERAQIDLTEKRHNKYVQGAIARSRRYDRDNIKELEDEKILSVEYDVDEVMTMKKKKRRGSRITDTVVQLAKDGLVRQVRKA